MGDKGGALTVRNWTRWQSYRKGRGQPPWIKLHRCVMRNAEWVSLTDAQRGQLVAIWLLAADQSGAIPASAALVRKLCFMEEEPDLNLFIHLGFLESGANAAPTCRQDDANVSLQNRREEKRKEAEGECEGEIQTNVDNSADPPDSSRFARSRTKPKPPTPPAPLSDEQSERLDHLRKRVQAGTGLRQHAEALDRVLMDQVRQGAPFSALEQGMLSVLEHKPDDPAAYLAKVLRVESPNHHAAKRELEGQAFKQLDVGGILGRLARGGANA